MAEERGLKKAKCHFSLPLQNRPACLSLGLAAGQAAWLSASPLPRSTDTSGGPRVSRVRVPPRPQSVVTCGEVEGLSLRGDGCDLQCRHA